MTPEEFGEDLQGLKALKALKALSANQEPDGDILEIDEAEFNNAVPHRSHQQGPPPGSTHAVSGPEQPQFSLQTQVAVQGSQQQDPPPESTVRFRSLYALDPSKTIFNTTQHTGSEPEQPHLLSNAKHTEIFILWKKGPDAEKVNHQQDEKTALFLWSRCWFVEAYYMMQEQTFVFYLIVKFLDYAQHCYNLANIQSVVKSTHSVKLGYYKLPIDLTDCLSLFRLNAHDPQSRLTDRVMDLGPRSVKIPDDAGVLFIPTAIVDHILHVFLQSYDAGCIALQHYLVNDWVVGTKRVLFARCLNGHYTGWEFFVDDGELKLHIYDSMATILSNAEAKIMFLMAFQICVYAEFIDDAFSVFTKAFRDGATITVVKTPRQDGANDCGLFTLMILVYRMYGVYVPVEQVRGSWLRMTVADKLCELIDEANGTLALQRQPLHSLFFAQHPPDNDWAGDVVAWSGNLNLGSNSTVFVIALFLAELGPSMMLDTNEGQGAGGSKEVVQEENGVNMDEEAWPWGEHGFDDSDTPMDDSDTETEDGKDDTEMD